MANVFSKIGLWMDGKKASAQEAALIRRYPARAKAMAWIIALGRVKADWETKGLEEFPGMRTDGVAWVKSCAGLAAFFEARSANQSMDVVALPSLAADSVWHAWMRVDTNGLRRFCSSRYGRDFPHETKAEMESSGSPMEPALARCWAASCHAEGFEPLSGKMPSLFKLDAELNMPGGWAYRFDKKKGRVVHADISSAGRIMASRESEHPGMTAAGLFAVGAIGAVELNMWTAQSAMAQERAARAQQGGGGGCGGGCGIGFSNSSGGWGDSSGSSDGGDGGGSGSGDGGGSSCGSGCGGGCGG